MKTKKDWNEKEKVSNGLRRKPLLSFLRKSESSVQRKKEYEEEEIRGRKNLRKKKSEKDITDFLWVPTSEREKDSIYVYLFYFYFYFYYYFIFLYILCTYKVILVLTILLNTLVLIINFSNVTDRFLKATHDAENYSWASC